jgi:tRNA nucleotidyltransferase (CCA-adding enzyme)
MRTKVHERGDVHDVPMTEGRTGLADAEAARVEARVAPRLAPSAEFLAKVERLRQELPARVQAAAKARSSPLVRAVVAGSAARGTFLTDRLDIDLFLLFPPDLSRERLRDEGLALGREVLDAPEMRYAEHPYLRGKFEGFAVDAVPGFAISDPSHPLSPVDRTPFHQEYLAARENPELVNQIRLAKQFLRGLGVYGSEARTEGLSGYLVELLVLRFGSLRGLLRAARGWRIPVDLSQPGGRPPRLPEEVALVLPDPVDPHRNVASALSRRNLGTLIVASAAYLERPTEAWFEVRPPTAVSLEEALRRVRERDSHVVVVELARPPLVDDTLYPQVRKAERSLADEVVRSGFELLGSSSAADAEHVVVAIEVGTARRPAVRVRTGPPAGLDRVGQFLEKWTGPGAGSLQGPFLRPDGTLGVETRWEVRELGTVVAEALPRLSFGKNLTPEDPTKVKVRELAFASDTPALGEALRGLLAKGLPWLEGTASPATR